MITLYRFEVGDIVRLNPKAANYDSWVKKYGLGPFRIFYQEGKAGEDGSWCKVQSLADGREFEWKGGVPSTKPQDLLPEHFLMAVNEADKHGLPS